MRFSTRTQDTFIFWSVFNAFCFCRGVEAAHGHMENRSLEGSVVEGEPSNRSLEDSVVEVKSTSKIDFELFVPARIFPISLKMRLQFAVKNSQNTNHVDMRFSTRTQETFIFWSVFNAFCVVVLRLLTVTWKIDHWKVLSSRGNLQIDHWKTLWLK